MRVFFTKKSCLIAFSLLLSSFFNAKAQNTYYVDAFVTGPGTGTSLDPYKNIQDAINAASATTADIISVAAGGNYSLQNVTINKNISLVKTGLGTVFLNSITFSAGAQLQTQSAPTVINLPASSDFGATSVTINATASPSSELRDGVLLVATGGIVTVGAGTFSVTQPVIVDKSNVTIRAANNYNISPVTTSTPRANETLLVLSGTANFDFADNVDNTIIEGFQIQTSSAGTPENNIFELNNNHDGITIRNNWYDATSTAARQFLENFSAVVGTTNNLAITNNQIAKAPSSSIYAAVDIAQGVDISISRNIFSLNSAGTVNAVGLGQETGGTLTNNIRGSVVLLQNYFTGITGYALQLRSKADAGSFLITNNEMSGVGGGQKGISFMPSQYGSTSGGKITISENNIVNFNSALYIEDAKSEYSHSLITINKNNFSTSFASPATFYAGNAGTSFTGTITANLNFWTTDVNGPPRYTVLNPGAPGIAGSLTTTPSIQADVWITSRTETAPFSVTNPTTYGFQLAPSITTAYTSLAEYLDGSGNYLSSGASNLRNAINAIIQAPLSLSGWTLIVLFDTYAEADDIIIDKPLTLVGNADAGGGTVKIGTPGISTTQALITVNADDVTIDNFRLEVNQVGASNVPTIRYGIKSVGNYNNLLIKNCVITDDAASGIIPGTAAIYLDGTAGHKVTLHKNTLGSSGTGRFSEGFYIVDGYAEVGGTDLTTMGNQIYGDNGVRSENNQGGDLLIQNNAFDSRAAGIRVTNTANPIIVNANRFNSNHTYFMSFTPGSGSATTVDASTNTFNIAGLYRLPATMPLAELFTLEDKIGHKMDVASLNAPLVMVVPNNLYVTNQAAVAPFGANNDIQRAVNLATADGWTVSIKTGTYTPGVTNVDKSLTFVSQAGASIPSLTMNGTNKLLTVDGSLTVTGAITFTQGNIELKTGDFTYSGTAGNLTGFSATSHFVTNAAAPGRLVYSNIAASTARIFPIGRSVASFTPVTITNPDVSTFAVRAVDITNSIVPNSDPVNGYNSTDPAATSGHALQTIWFVDRVAGTGAASLALQWDATIDEQPLFDRTNCFVSRHTGTQWLRDLGSIGTASPLGGNLYAKYGSFNQFSPIAVADVDSPLPVELVDFRATLQENVVLNWTTTSETDNSYFAVERSRDGQTYEEIGKVNGRGNSSELNMYRFDDVEATSLGAAVLYYRLRQVDLDGKFAYSKVQSVHLVAQNGAVMKAFPNPACDQITVKAAGTNRLSVHNVHGKLILEKDFTDETIVDVTTIPHGIYLFRTFNGTQYEAQKVKIY